MIQQTLATTRHGGVVCGNYHMYILPIIYKTLLIANMDGQTPNSRFKNNHLYQVCSESVSRTSLYDHCTPSQGVGL